MKLEIKLILCIIVSIILLGSFAKAEISLWSNQLMNGVSNGTDFNIFYNSTVQDHIFYQFDDTSIEGTGRNKEITLQLYYSIMPLPYNLTGYGGEVDACYLIVRHFINVYDSDGNRINTTIEYTSLNFSTNVSSDFGILGFDMRSDDSVTGDIYCHYTNSSTLYVENILAGRWTTWLPSFECKGCQDYSLETLTNELDTLDARLSDQNQIYSSIQTFANYDFQLWLIVKWLVALSFFFVGLYLIFYSVYFVYSTLKKIESSI